MRAEIAVALGPDLHHRRVILGVNLGQRRRPERGDGHRAGVVRVVLVRRRRRQQPGCQLRLDVHDALTSGHELLGQQIPDAAGALHSPRPLLELRCPLQQPSDLARRGAYSKRAERHLALVDRRRGMRPLVRVDSDHHCHGRLLLIVGLKNRGRHV